MIIAKIDESVLQDEPNGFTVLLLEPEYRDLFIHCYKQLNYNPVLYPLVISDPDEYYNYNPSTDGDYITFLLFDPKLDYDNNIQQFEDKIVKIGRHSIQFYTTNFMVGYYSIIYYKKTIINALSHEYKYTRQYINHLLYIYIYRLIYTSSISTINGPMSFSVSGYAYSRVLLTKYEGQFEFNTDYPSSGQFLSYMFDENGGLCDCNSYLDTGSLYTSEKSKHLLVALFPTDDIYGADYCASQVEVIYAVCDLINSYSSFIYGIIQPIFPYYKTNISEIIDIISNYAERPDVLAFTGLLTYILM